MKNIIMRNIVCYSMNNSLSEIQADIQRLANQQNQIQQQHLMSQHQKQMQHQLQQLQSLSQQHMQVRMPEIYPTSCIISYFFSYFTLQTYGMPPMNPLTPRLQDPQQSQFYLHDQPQVQRRMWGQPAPAQSLANEMAAVGYQQSMDSRFSPQPTGTYQINLE